jgi:hypothetical protein
MPGDGGLTGDTDQVTGLKIGYARVSTNAQDLTAQRDSAWLVLAAIAFNLTRAAGALAGTSHARAVTATIRAQLISIPARITRSARRTTLRLPTNWPWRHSFETLFAAALSPPTTT